MENGLVAAHGWAAEFSGTESGNEFVRLAKAIFGQPLVEKARDGFFNGLLVVIGAAGVAPLLVQKNTGCQSWGKR
ncbi:hypothetical protein [Desulfurivibrio dismutans]|uniref:hypothetical protein n=1 Tax=Desulfurivibrio dismutans TaxID=1398908 RepID=UPI0023DB7FC8|nr:hypothetical protein [Desulfurivibrio alkaliphilus]MDF1613597.1 hypothetical protein [Desulfurivibrio alkaliphilus]